MAKTVGMGTPAVLARIRWCSAMLCDVLAVAMVSIVESQCTLYQKRYRRARPTDERSVSVGFAGWSGKAHGDSWAAKHSSDTATGLSTVSAWAAWAWCGAP